MTSDGTSPATARPLAHIQCAEFGFGVPTVFRRQFRLTQGGLRPVNGFQTREIGGWLLEHCPLLPVTELQDKDGTVCGAVFGIAGDPDDRRVTDGYRFNKSVTDPGFMDSVDQFFTWSSGRFVGFVAHPDLAEQGRVYVDPGASYGCVFDPETKIVASSLLLSLVRPIEDRDDYDHDAIVGGAQMSSDAEPVLRGTPVPFGYYCFGHTRDRSVTRLRANHFLSLGDFAVHRHWPVAGQQYVPAETSISAAGQQIGLRLARNTKLLTDGQSGVFALSGGYDSRMLLAHAASILPDSFQIYTHAMSWTTSIDAQLAERLARIVDRPLKSVVPPGGNVRRGSFLRPARSINLARQYLLSTGYLSAQGPHERRGVYEWIDNDAILLRGNMLELVSAVLEPNHKKITDRAFFEFLIETAQAQVATPDHEEARMQDAKAWFASIPEEFHNWVHDLNYTENRLSHSQAGMLFPGRFFYAAPACDRKIFALCSHISPEDRKARNLYRAVVEAGCPALLDIPTLAELRHELAARDVKS